MINIATIKNLLCTAFLNNYFWFFLWGLYCDGWDRQVRWRNCLDTRRCAKQPPESVTAIPAAGRGAPHTGLTSSTTLLYNQPLLPVFNILICTYPVSAASFKCLFSWSPFVWIIFISIHCPIMHFRKVWKKLLTLFWTCYVSSLLSFLVSSVSLDFIIQRSEIFYSCACVVNSFGITVVKKYHLWE